MGAPMNVRQLGTADRQVVTDIATEARLALSLDEELAKGFCEVWVAEQVASEPIAFVLVWRAGDVIDVVTMATRTVHRRRGAARALLAHVLAHAGSLGLCAVQLEVRASNLPALTLYHSLGFRTTRRRVGYYSDGEDGVEMRHSLR
jgi:ribosomal protein S18 acetylase RimI-like enzyme